MIKVDGFADGFAASLREKGRQKETSLRPLAEQRLAIVGFFAPCAGLMVRHKANRQHAGIFFAQEVV